MDPEKKKRRLLDGMSAHVLEHGLSGASLRPLAKAVGTSDRMLIYHFGSKDRLVESLLVHIAGKLKLDLDASLPPRRAASRMECVAEILAVLSRDEIAPFARVWFDILSAAQKGDNVQKQIGHEIMASLHGWLMERLPESETDAPATAMALLALIEGLVVLNAVGHGEAAAASIHLLLGSISPFPQTGADHP
ncbi:MAG TPA: TetR/AcrR family transcriptional regulator [Rhizobiaceae bacterium]|nr:TetR/AcrR family transcriptional regulator [Rhizobiaceae bacterium]